MTIPPVTVKERLRTDLGPRRSLVELGYAFLPGLIDREAVLDVRQRLLACAAEAGWVQLSGGDEVTVRQLPADDDLDARRPAYRAMQRVEQLHALGDAPQLHEVVGSVLGEPFFRYPSTVHRLKVRGSLPTPPHPDWFFLQGSPDSLTAWLPLGDLGEDEGGLAVLSGSHRLGLYWSDWTSADERKVRWHGGSYRAGDVLLFHALTVHAALPYRGRGVRVSADFRYQPLRDPVHEAWTVPHFDVGSWDEIAAGWRRPDARYWERLPLRVTDQREEDVAMLSGRCRPRLFDLADAPASTAAPEGLDRGDRDS